NYKKLISLCGKEAILKGINATTVKNEFEFIIPSLTELSGIFKACHNLIWKKEKINPTDAFYEFSKLFFVKLEQDKKLHENYLDKGKILKKEHVALSEDWIKKQSEFDKNPVDNMLFKQLRNDLENQI